MRQMMSAATRNELLVRTSVRYRNATWSEKGKILSEIVAVTGFTRKRAITLLNHPPADTDCPGKRQVKPRRYDTCVQQALITIWKASNYLCSKRLVPFLPEFVVAMERFGHLTVDDEVRRRLLSMSAATVDRILYPQRHASGRGISTTRPGQLLKHQIPIRTFADWNDVVPGFLEADLVAHCGDNASGCFIHTLTLTDISTGWTECVALLHRSEGDVTGALGEVRKTLPFPLLGLDTDNGGEFINYEMLRYCQRENITFTRGRAYKKNDQAHVEQKNRSIVRRLVGYDRYEGVEAWKALSALYSALRLYINFFQPSLKLMSKQRDVARVTKRYGKAQTPYQRLLAIGSVTEEHAERLRCGYERLDPVALLEEIQRLQDQFWQHGWQKPVNQSDPKPDSAVVKVTQRAGVATSCDPPDKVSAEPAERRQYRRTKKERVPHTWRTREDPFEQVWGQVRVRLEINPAQTAMDLFKVLQEQHPDAFSPGQLRTLQRRVRVWRREHVYSAEVVREEFYSKVASSEDRLATHIVE